jgi:hypothetical protein
MEYVKQGELDEQREQHLADSSRLQMALLFSKGLVIEMAWIIAHANQHAWQLNYLFEATMFGSILDRGSLIGKLDRAEEKDVNPIVHLQSLVEKRLLMAHQFGLCVAHMGCATIATPLVKIYHWRISIYATHNLSMHSAYCYMRH